jgi:hypothetical protein
MMPFRAMQTAQCDNKSFEGNTFMSTFSALLASSSSSSSGEYTFITYLNQIPGASESLQQQQTAASV